MLKRTALLLIASVIFLSLDSAASAGILKGTYLLYEGSNTSITVLWQDDATESNIIRWGEDTGYSSGSFTSTEYGSDHQHKYTITNLQPGHLYYYQVDGYGSGSFRTAPAPDATSVKLLAYGDTRSDPTTHNLVAGAMRSAYASEPAYQSIVLLSGDWVSADGDSYWRDQYFVNTNAQMHAFQAEVPALGARGNHEGAGTSYGKYFPYPYISNFYWSFDYGPVHVSVVDQYTSYTTGSAQYNWLSNDLATSTKPWKIILLHEPGWSAAGGHTNNTSVQTYIQPLCEQYHVSMVIAGHNHYYARAVVNGVQHVTAGGGGAPLATPDPGQPNLVATAKQFHFCEIDVSSSSLTLTARKTDGSVIDSVVVSNALPVAVAGPDQTVTDTDGNGAEDIQLDGSSSYDPDGSISGYEWIMDGEVVANFASPTISVPVGPHTVSLTVTDNRGGSSSASINVTVLANTPTVTAAINPPGSGVVVGSGIDCPDTCYAEYINGSLVELLATAYSGYRFSTWSGCMSSIDDVCRFTITTDQDITANFSVCGNGPARNVGTGTSYFSTIQEAYNAAGSGNVVQTQAVIFRESPAFSSNVSLTLKGGYDCEYLDNSHQSFLNGSMTISRGTITLENITIR